MMFVYYNDASIHSRSSFQRTTYKYTYEYMSICINYIVHTSVVNSPLVPYLSLSRLWSHLSLPPDLFLSKMMAGWRALRVYRSLLLESPATCLSGRQQGASRPPALGEGGGVGGSSRIWGWAAGCFFRFRHCRRIGRAGTRGTALPGLFFFPVVYP
jgi:hypothetical protein